MTGWTVDKINLNLSQSNVLEAEAGVCTAVAVGAHFWLVALVTWSATWSLVTSPLASQGLFPFCPREFDLDSFVYRYSFRCKTKRLYSILFCWFF
jgi:hypothetical protein